MQIIICILDGNDDSTVLNTFLVSRNCYWMSLKPDVALKIDIGLQEANKSQCQMVADETRPSRGPDLKKGYK